MILMFLDTGKIVGTSQSRSGWWWVRKHGDTFEVETPARATPEIGKVTWLNPSKTRLNSNFTKFGRWLLLPYTNSSEIFARSTTFIFLPVDCQWIRSLIWILGWTRFNENGLNGFQTNWLHDNQDAGDLRRHRAHYDVTVRRPLTFALVENTVLVVLIAERWEQRLIESTLYTDNKSLYNTWVTGRRVVTRWLSPRSPSRSHLYNTPQELCTQFVIWCPLLSWWRHQMEPFWWFDGLELTQYIPINLDYFHASGTITTRLPHCHLWGNHHTIAPLSEKPEILNDMDR